MELEEALAKIETLEQEKSALLAKRDELLGTVKDLKTKYRDPLDGMDIEELKTVHSRYKKGELVVKDTIKSELENQLSAQSAQQLKELQEQIQTLKDGLEAERRQKTEALVRGEFTNALGSVGAISPKQVLTILQAEGRVKVSNENGVEKIVGLYKGEELAPAELAKRLREDTDYQHLFKADNMSGSGATFTDGTEKKSNPFAKDSYNLTAQMKLLRENPQLAAQLKKEAGLR